VLIPAANRGHLMLRDDVAEAASAGLFPIGAASEVDDALQLLTGMRAGVPDKSGVHPEGGVLRQVEGSALAQYGSRKRSLP
jgi:hypothetical protein